MEDGQAEIKIRLKGKITVLHPEGNLSLQNGLRAKGLE